jgi:tetratricopeptide (TPR) repeat protein
VVETPSEIEYETPRNNAISPQTARSPPRNSGKGKQVAQTQSESEDEGNGLCLSWHGSSREQLISIFESARSHAENQSSRAEDLFSTALEGYGYLLGPTHEESVKVAFAMATFYTEQGRSADADKVIEDVCRCHISKFGFEDRRTQQLIIHVVEVLNGWNRGIDALAFLARSKDLAETGTALATTRRTKTRRRGKTPRARNTMPDNELLEIAQDIVSTRSAARVDYGIGVARSHVAANDVAVEAFLQAIIHHCDGDLEALEIQNLKARSELLKFYNKTNRNFEQRADFLSAIDAATVSIFRAIWDKQSFKSFEILEALLELSASILKGSFEDDAYRIFSQIEHKAEDDFGWDEERTIWTKINIGIIYETTKGWDYAKEWFNHAYAASIAANGDEDGISKSLQIALDKRHFSYISDEGRPFKTIFGVNGITFRPTRLHID